MGKALDDFRQLGREAVEVMSDVYLDALNAIARGENPEPYWKQFRDMLTRALILSSLLGGTDVVNKMRVKGIENEAIVEDEIARYQKPTDLLVGPFIDALNLFLDKIPRLRAEVDRLAPLARARSFWVTDVESTAALGRIQQFISQRLEGKIDVGLTEFLDFAKEGPARNLSLARLETVYRTNVQTAFNEGAYRQMTIPEVQSATALWVLDEIQDRRTRGNPGGLYPDAGPHYQMDGFLERPGHPVWQRIWPPNGYNCRASVSPMTWVTARTKGFADASNNLNQPAIDRWNGRRWEFIRNGEYPDPGFESGAIGLGAA